LLTPRYQGGHLLISDRRLHGHANLINGKRVRQIRVREGVKGMRVTSDE
jgi:hypothetical protein